MSDGAFGFQVVDYVRGRSGGRGSAGTAVYGVVKGSVWGRTTSYWPSVAPLRRIFISTLHPCE